MVIGDPIPRHVQRPEGGLLRKVRDYKYLGCMLQSSKTDFQRNKQLARVALHKLKATWRSTLAMATKAWLFRCLVLSIFLAGAEAWVVGTELRADVIGAYTCMVRYVKGIKLTTGIVYQMPRSVA
ncbi:hypothetical protein DIPPA_02941 [Diplonema papillatum]|nr:hypothetical protein DIPPA_02941 [Diplonema papillatum]